MFFPIIPSYKSKVNPIHNFSPFHAKNSADNQVIDLDKVRTLADQKEAESAAKLLAACGYDALAAGNHDWNYGKDRLLELEDIVQSENGDFAILAGNVIKEDGSPFFEQEFITKEIEGDSPTLKIGVFGVIDPAIYSATAPGNVADLTFTDMAAYAKEAAQTLREEMGCHLVIGLAHCIAPVSLAAQVNGVDTWIAGHEHYEINETVKMPEGGDTLVVETGCNLWTVGDMEISCTLNETGDLTDLSMTENLLSYEEGAALPPDPEMTALFDEIHAAQEPILSQVVGYAPEDLDACGNTCGSARPPWDGPLPTPTFWKQARISPLKTAAVN